MLKDQGRAHEVHAVAGRLNRRGVGSRAVPDARAQAGRVREDRQGHARVHLRRVLLVQGCGLGHRLSVDGVEEALVVGAGKVGAISLFGAVAEGFPSLVGDFGGATGDAEGGAAVCDQVQGGGLLGEVEGILVAHVDDTRAHLDGLRARGDGGEEWHGRGRLRGEVVDAEEGAIDAKLICGDGQVDRLVKGLGGSDAVAATVRVVAEAQESEVFHDVTLRHIG